MPLSKQDRQRLATELFTAYSGSYYAIELTDLFNARLSRRKRGPGQQKKMLKPGTIRQWKHAGELPYYAAPIAVELLEVANGG